MSKPNRAFASVIFLALLCVGLLAFAGRADVTKASYTSVNTIVGVDAITTGNTATTLGNIDRCVSVNPNDTFYVDLFVKNVTNLNNWQGTLRTDGSLLEVSNIDVGYFLATTPGSVLFNGSDPVPNTTGSFQAGAFDEEYLAESGSGVLARVQMKALAAGTSKLYFSLWWPFGLSGVQLEDSDFNPIGDVDGDTYFDGLVFNSIVVVGGPCPKDADGDGFNNIDESIDGSDLLAADSTPEVCNGVDDDLDPQSDEGYDRAPVNGIADCVDPAADSDGDTTPNPSDPDDDNDGFTDVQEAYMGTDSLADCPLTIYHNAWPLDVNNDTSITVVGDVLKYSGLIGVACGNDSYRRRLDFNNDCLLSVVGDVIRFSGHIGDTCS
jgi:hypothetical protein